MVFRENAPRPPRSPSAPRYPATCARNAAKLQRPRAMRLIWSIACERAPLNRDRNTANLGEHVKRNKETRQQRTDRGLSLHRFFQLLSGCVNVVRVEVIEDFEVLFKAPADELKDPVEGKAAVRALLAGFLVPLHVFAEIGGVSVSIQWSPLTGDRPDETHSAWTLELRGVTGASCRVTWCSRRRWRAGRVLSEHHYDHHQIGGPLTFSDLRLSGGETAGNVPTLLAKPQ